MKAMRSLKESWFVRTWPVLICCGLILAACAHVNKVQTATESALNEDAARMTWQEGRAAFQRGDYGMAQQYFEAVSKRASNETLRRKGLYGLACTRLVAAQSIDEYNAALNLWELWMQMAPPELIDEDPRMLSPLLFNLSPGDLAKASSTVGAVSPETPRTSTTPTVRIVKDRECEKQLRESDRELQRLKRQIRTLRLQIEALEAIHRKIQEKKKEVSSP